MDILKIVLTIIFAIDCIVLSAIILLQEGKSAGLGTISGMADTYWGQNKEMCIRDRSQAGWTVYIPVEVIRRALIRRQKMRSTDPILSLIHI